MQVVERFLLCV